MVSLGPRLLILYASQTGYAQETAERIAREAKQRRYTIELKSMDEFDVNKLASEKLVIFVCSVVGQGENPDSMKPIWTFLLRKSLPPKLFHDLSFGVFGQGDTSYPKYNYPAKKLHNRLVQLSGIPIVSRGDGDDQHNSGVDGALDPWLSELWEKCALLFPIPFHLSAISPLSRPINSYELSVVKGDWAVKDRGSLRSRVAENTRITSRNHFQDVRHLEFDIDESCKYHLLTRYNVGDCMILYPRNDPIKIQNAIEFFGWEDIADKFIKIIPHDGSVNLFDDPITLRTLFERHLDIFGRPRRYFFQLLSHFTNDTLHKERLQDFASTEGQVSYFNKFDLNIYAHRPRRTIFETLQDFKSVKVPLDYLLDLIPRIRPRYFSISSSLAVFSGKINLTVAIVDYKTLMKERRVGICTSWIAGLKSGDIIDFDIGIGTFDYNPKLPIICIGPGTGVAPMRALIFEHMTKSDTECLLFFGCRNKSADFLYESEWKELDPSRFTLITAFSRDQAKKIYVQHRLLEHGQKIWGLIAKGAVVYLSGNAKQMPTDIMDALLQIFVLYGGMSEGEAQKFLKQLEKSHRLQQECWS